MDKSGSSKEKEKKVIKRNWFSKRRIMFLSFLVFMLSVMILKMKFHFNIFNYNLIIKKNDYFKINLIIVIIFYLNIFNLIKYLK